MSSFCGCWYLPAPPKQSQYYQYIPKRYLPLLESEAHSTILSTTSRTVLKQTFKNPSSTDAIKECTYAFPLYDGVSVVSFTCRVGKKVLRGLVKEKAKAQEIFDKAVAKGETAGLLQQAPEASDMFSTKLGNIPAGESVIVEITYIGELKHHETEGIRFTIPTKIAPRYGSGPDYGTPSGVTAQNHDGIKIVVDVNMPEGSFIKGVQSPSHPIAVSMGTVSTASSADPAMSKASATLSLGTATLEKDFVLIVQSKDIGTPKAIMEIHPTLSNHRALMVTLVPKFSLPPSRPEIVFVADRSGSMAHNISMLQSAMNVFLKSMPTGVKFNICSFGSSHSFLWEKSQSYTKDTLKQATKHVQTFGADMGGTETFGAIRATIERRWSDLPLEIILLTDGDIQSQHHLFDYVNEQVEESKGKIRIFPLGIGSGVSHALIEGLARAGNGFAQAVQDGERLDNCVVRMLRGALTPHITDYTLEVKYGKDDDDFEEVEKVTEGLKVLLSDRNKITSTEQKPKATISLFDNTVDPEKESIKELKDSNHSLSKVPTPKLLQAPNKIPSLYAFSRTTVYLLMSPETIQRNPTAVVLRATSEHGTLALEIPIEVLAARAETIHQLAAKKAVQDLEEGRGWIHDAKNQDGISVKDVHPSSFDDLVEREAVRLGEKFQIAGQWCSFVAVTANEKKIVEKAKGDNTGEETKEEFDMIGEDDIEEYSCDMSQLYTGPKVELRSRVDSMPVNYKPKSRGGVFTARSSAFSTGAFGASGPGPAPRSKGLFRSFASPFQPMAQPQQPMFGSASVPPPPPMQSMSSGGGGLFSTNTPPAPAPAAPMPSAFGISSVMRKKSSRGPAMGSFGAPPGSASPPGFTPQSTAPTSIADKVLALIELQDFDGFWASDSKKRAFNIVGVKDTDSPVGVDAKVWLTILVVKFLQEKCGEEQGTWELVVEKARAWLDGCGVDGLEGLEEKAGELLG
ncbi:von Willebrand domain-containing protein [Cadophora sp. MPI-SDFR-AT-0126]|nr:von Willebrand domain-containing protein [Leotiomycetes sp. MPI-SDFR-AT-0126]